MTTSRRTFLLSLLSFVGISGATYMVTTSRRKALSPLLPYPIPPSDQTLDTYFGTPVADPYRPLEQLDSKATRAWVMAENHLTQEVLRQVAGRSEVARYLEKIWNYPRTSLPKIEANRHFFAHNSGLEKQPRLYMAQGYAGPWRLMVDPLVFNPEGTVSISDFEPSPDGRNLAYSLSDSGSDRVYWHILEVDSGRKFEEIISYTKFTPVAWRRDGSGFYYSRHPAFPDGSINDNVPVSIYFHRLHTAQKEDQLIVALDHPTRNPFPAITDDGRYLIVTVIDGYEHNALYYIDLESVEQKLVRLCDAWDALYYFVGNIGTKFFVRTTAGAPRGRIVLIDVALTKRSAWQTHIAETEHALDAVTHFGNDLAVVRLVDSSSQVDIYEATSGIHRRKLVLPGIGSVEGFAGRAGNSETFFSFSSFVEPPRLYRYNAHTDELSLWQSSGLSGLPSCEVTRIEAQSADTTSIRAFVLAAPNTRQNGTAPTLLYGYGGFAYALTPTFSTQFHAWIAMGGIVVVANLRGGGEHGEAWHLAGARFNKQRVFEDFIAIAEHLVAKKYTSPQHMAIIGASNGGLLVGAVVNQRPDLFAAVVAEVGVMDMLRYHLSCANSREWGSEYGVSTASEADFKNLFAYSPYHAISERKTYPALFALTADHDDRVAPWHTYKWVAKLQATVGVKRGAQPILLRVETRAGHGAGKSVTQAIAETTDILLFLKKNIPGLHAPKMHA